MSSSFAFLFPSTSFDRICLNMDGVGLLLCVYVCLEPHVHEPTWRGNETKPVVVDTGSTMINRQRQTGQRQGAHSHVTRVCTATFAVYCAFEGALQNFPRLHCSFSVLFLFFTLLLVVVLLCQRLRCCVVCFHITLFCVVVLCSAWWLGGLRDPRLEAAVSRSTGLREASEAAWHCKARSGIHRLLALPGSRSLPDCRPTEIPRPCQNACIKRGNRTEPEGTLTVFISLVPVP